MEGPRGFLHPPAAGLRQGEVGEQDVPHFMWQWIDQAIRRSTVEGMCQQFQVPAQMYTLASEMGTQRNLLEVVDCQDPDSPTPSELSFYLEDYQGKRIFLILSKTLWPSCPLGASSTPPS